MAAPELISPMKLAKSLGRRPQVIYALLRKNPHLVHEVNGRKMVNPQEVMKYLGAPRVRSRSSSNSSEDFNLPSGFVVEGAWIHANIWVIPDEHNRPLWVKGRRASGKEVTLSRRKFLKLIRQGKIQPIDVDALLEALLELKRNHPDTYNKSYQTWKQAREALGLDPEEEDLL